MMHRTVQLSTAQLLAGLILATGLAGCSQTYNGATSMGRSDAKRVVERREPRQVPLSRTASNLQPEKPLPTDTARATHRPTPPVPSPTMAAPVRWGGAEVPVATGQPTPATSGQATPFGPTTASAPANPMLSAASPATEAVFEEVKPSRPASPVAPSYTAPADPQRAAFHRFGEMGLAGGANAVGPMGRPASSPLDAQDNLRRVTFTGEGADFDIDADPTGQWIAFASTRHRQTADLYLQRVNGTAVTQLTTDPSNDVMPTFSPDGTQVAFASDRAGSWDIYLMPTAGGPAVKLTDDAMQNIHPSFSPDGRQLVYSSYGSQAGVWELVLIDIAAPTHRRVIGHGLFPNRSPNSNTIVYQRARERGSRWFSVWTVDLKDGEAQNPTEIAASGNAAVITPDWSPDGRSIVFCTVLDPATDSTAAARADIWVCNADGSGRARLTQGSYGNLQPAWASDGSIYFVSDRGVDGVENVYALRPDQAIHLARQNQRTQATQDNAEANVPTE